jgi:hypothetical protein
VQGQRAQIIAAARQDVEGVKLNLVIVLAGMQGVEVGDPLTPSTTASPSMTSGGS